MKWVAALCLAVALCLAPAARAERDVLEASRTLLLGSDAESEDAAQFFMDRGNTDIIPTLAMFFRLGGSHRRYSRVFHALTGEDVSDWRGAMLYQEAHPEIVPHPSFYDLKFWYWGARDRALLDFFDDPPNPDTLRIRFEEIVWGGVGVDDIPSLDRPALIAADKADYLAADDLVFGVSINGDIRAYPLRIMGWHEMLNDVIGGVPVSLAYCTLCGAGILFETVVPGQEGAFEFGTSGLLYRSNKLMFDRQTRSLWNQFTGEPVVGPMAQSGVRLKILPTTVTSWRDWRRLHPETRVLSLETGFARDYGSGVAYRDYFASPDLLFPALSRDDRLAQKDRVFGIRVAGGAKAWPIGAFAKTQVLNDKVGLLNVVLIGDATTETVRAYDRGAFEFSGTAAAVLGPGGQWRVTEDALLGPKGERLPRVAGHMSFWFAWDSYLGAESVFYQAD